MPQVFKIWGYTVYFWANEGKPTEPLHVHISKGVPTENGTKIWITSTGKCICPKKTSIPQITLNRIIKVIEARSEYIKQKWLEQFGEITYIV